MTAGGMDGHLVPATKWSVTMRCAQCGADLVTGDRHCGRCGAPVPVDEAGGDTVKLVRGVPIAPQAPSVYGPPIGPETRVGVTEFMEIEPPEKHILGYRPFVPPPPPPLRRRGGCLRVVAIAALLLILVLVATDIFAHGNIHFLGIGARPSVTATSTSPAAIVCVAQPVKAAASQALTHAQLTSGLQDAAKKDYRPIDNVTTVHVGQRVYLTFQIATNKAGTVGVEFCTKSEKLDGVLAVPAKSGGRYAEFLARFTSEDVGTNVATLTWDGAVAATKTFTVKQ